MKTLYIHCGYHKTGRSLLQTVFAGNRKLLYDFSIYCPLPTKEHEILQGVITNGNGKGLMVQKNRS